MAKLFRKPALLLCDLAQPFLVQPYYFALVPSPFRRGAKLLSSLSVIFCPRPLLLPIFPMIFPVSPPGFFRQPNAFILCALVFRDLTPLLGKSSSIFTRSRRL